MTWFPRTQIPPKLTGSYLIGTEVQSYFGPHLHIMEGNTAEEMENAG
jgi:hypothetical protein